MAATITPAGEELRASRERRAARPLFLPLDPFLCLAVVGLGICSLIILNTLPGAGGSVVLRQAVYLVVGSVLMLVLARVDYSGLRELKYGIYGLLFLSIFAVLGLGSSALGSTRAISLPFFSFQASELGKVLLTLALAGFVVDRVRRLRTRDATARVMLLGLVPAALVIVQPDLGSGLVYITITLTILFVAGTGWRHIAALLTLIVLSATLVLVVAPAFGVHVLHQYQVDRLTNFLHLSQGADQSRYGYQQDQSVIAIGSGGRTGRGAASLQVGLDYVPEARTDFIFAAVGERYGFVGAALVLALYALLIWRALRITAIAKNLFGALVAGGIVAMLMFQVFVNVGMALGIMPITGVTLPLLSYGGSSVLTTLLAIGLLQSIYVQGQLAGALKARVLRF